MDHSSKRTHIRRVRPRSAMSRPRSGSPSRASFRKKASKESVNRPLLQEYSVNLLRRSLSQSSSSFTGLEKQQLVGAPYASSSNYLRQLLLNEAENLLAPSAKQVKGSPFYKTQEEYYDEVIALKKQIQDLTNENVVLKLKVQRTEEEYLIRKQQDVNQNFMDSTKVENILRQKLSTVERALREKDLAFTKLQSDLKATKLEELKVKLDTYEAEIHRLQRTKGSRTNHSLSKSKRAFLGEESSKKTEELMKTLQKMGADKARLIQENKLLKEDLHRSLDKPRQANVDTNKKYDDTTKHELLSVIAKLEKKIEKLESGDFYGDDYKVHRKQSDMEGKLALEGSLVQRLDQLDKRESELLEDLTKKKSVIAQLREDRTYFRDKCAENEKEIKHLKKEIMEMKAEYSGGHGRYGRSDVGDRHSVTSVRNSPRSVSDRTSVSRWDHDQKFQVESFRRNRAARVIQRGWREHGRNRSHHDEDVALIRSTLKGHQIRKMNLLRLRGFMAEEDEDEEDDDEAQYSDDEAVERIQSIAKGHLFRSQQMTRRSSNAGSLQSFSQRRPSNSNSLLSFSGRTGQLNDLHNWRNSHNLSGSGRVITDDFDDGRHSTYSGRTSLLSGRTTPLSHTRSQIPERNALKLPLRTLSDESDDEVQRSGRRSPLF